MSIFKAQYAENQLLKDYIDWLDRQIAEMEKPMEYRDIFEWCTEPQRRDLMEIIRRDSIELAERAKNGGDR